MDSIGPIQKNTMDLSHIHTLDTKSEISPIRDSLVLSNQITKEKIVEEPTRALTKKTENTVTEIDTIPDMGVSNFSNVARDERNFSGQDSDSRDNSDKESRQNSQSLLLAKRENQNQAPGKVKSITVDDVVPIREFMQESDNIGLPLPISASSAKEIRPSSRLGTREYWVNQAKHVCDFFADVSVDEADGGFFTNINADGEITDTDKLLVPAGRQIYAYAETFRLTGEQKYLKLARHGVEFLLKNHMRMNDEGEVYWINHLQKDGTPKEGEENQPLRINEQITALSGLISCYNVTQDPELLYLIKQGHKFITNHFHDPEKGGFFDAIDPKNHNPVRTKSFSSTVYPATTALLEMADMAEGRWKMQILGQIKELADIVVQHFPDKNTGFINECFNQDWQADWTNWQKNRNGTIGIAGHNTQTALFLLRAERMLGLYDTNYAKAAQEILDSMLDKCFDHQRGGWYDIFIRETGEHALHTNKAYWQQGEGYLATLAMSTMRNDPKYREASRKTLEFWDKYFIDRTIGGDRASVCEDGTPLPEPKGSSTKSSFHSVEMAKLAMTFTGQT